MRNKMVSITCNRNYHGIVALSVLSLTFHAILVKSQESIGQMQTATEYYCPYFKNRAPSPQPDLKNCTWYKENSCCLQHELEIIFANIPPPDGASDRCRKYMNYLMCYVCAPNQNVFYSIAQERLTVCEEFCNDWFDACGEALLKGTKIKNVYDSGKEFCDARKFSVKEKASKKCFSYDENGDASSSATNNYLNIPTILFPCLVGFAVAVRFLNGKPF